jgi:hypothetical protein
VCSSVPGHDFSFVLTVHPASCYIIRYRCITQVATFCALIGAEA